MPTPAVRPPLRLVPPSRPAADRPSTAPPFDDSELLRSLRSGDTSAATAFHDRVRPQVDRTIFRLLGRRDVDHEDLVQLALIELVFTIDRFRGDCSLDGWVATVTSHVVYKHLRRRKTERRIFSTNDDANDDKTAQAPSPLRVGRQLMARSLVRRVREHLDAIDADKAWTFLLHDVCGHDLREIAEITGVSVAAAQTRLVRGRRDLHQRLGSDPELAELLTGFEGAP